MAENCIVEMNHINMAFGGNKVLDDVHFDLRAGEIHSVVGQNGAGKSTLIKILNGLYQPVSGEIKVYGRLVTLRRPKDAQDLGMEFVHQELNVCDYLSVAENIYIGNLPRTKTGLVDNREMFSRAGELLKMMGVDIPPQKLVRDLRNAEKQIVEIMKALTRESKIIIMDEPTSSLNEREKENFFAIVRRLKAQGISIIFISHFIEDVIELSDRVTVIKDGRNNGFFNRAQLDKDLLIETMMGQKISHVSFEANTDDHSKPVVLEVRDLCSRKKLKNISFSVREGSIIGVCGLLGAGKTEIARAIFGLDQVDSGDVYVAGERIARPSPGAMISRKVIFLSEDRKREGFIPLLSIRENETLSIFKRISKGGFIRPKKQQEIAQKMADRVTVKCTSIEQPVSKLSGGNQQKVIIGRCLITEPKVFMLDEPTRGVDVGAKAEIYRILQEVARKGTAVIVFSSELEELLNNCSDIIVLKQGKIVDIVKAEGMTKNDLLKMIG